MRWHTLCWLPSLPSHFPTLPLVFPPHLKSTPCMRILGLLWGNPAQTGSYMLVFDSVPPSDLFCSPSWGASLALESTLALSTLWSSTSCEAIPPLPWSQSYWGWAPALSRGSACHPSLWSRHGTRWVGNQRHQALESSGHWCHLPIYNLTQGWCGRRTHLCSQAKHMQTRAARAPVMHPEDGFVQCANPGPLCQPLVLCFLCRAGGTAMRASTRPWGASVTARGTGVSSVAWQQHSFVMPPFPESTWCFTTRPKTLCFMVRVKEGVVGRDIPWEITSSPLSLRQETIRCS